MSTTIKVAADFSNKRPFGRRPAHDPEANGERFRESFLIPALEKGPVVVDFGGCEYPIMPSFLEEAFGGLISRGFTYPGLKKVLEIRFPDDPARAAFVWGLIETAALQPAISARRPSISTGW